MRLCRPHWAALRAAIAKRDLAKFVSATGQESARRLAKEATAPDKDSFDPLMAAHNMIMKNALDIVGLALMEGDRCPICFLNEGAVDAGKPEVTFDYWIEKAADDALAIAAQRGLVGIHRRLPN